MSEQPSGGPPSTPSHDLAEYQYNSSFFEDLWLNNYLSSQPSYTGTNGPDWSFLVGSIDETAAQVGYMPFSSLKYVA
jgi:hypothetical protein